jgi:hypothetical protein
MKHVSFVVVVLVQSCVSSRVESPPADPPPAQVVPHLTVPSHVEPARPSGGLGLAGQAPALAPPSTVGQSRAEVTGCAASTTEADAQRFEVTTRGMPPPATIRAVKGGALVVHPLDHACCLKLVSTTRLEGNTAFVRETLSGTACRCRCGSTVSTAIALAPGSWSVVVEVDDAKGLRRAAQEQVEVTP